MGSAVAGPQLVRRSPLLGLAVLATVAVLAACGTETPGSSASSPVGSASSPAVGATDLVVVVDDGSGTTSTWRLTCDPPGGTHPDPAAACAALAAGGERFLPPVPADTGCTQVWGGPQTARVTGTWRGTAVTAAFTRANGCEIARWDGMAGLLPPGGVS